MAGAVVNWTFYLASTFVVYWQFCAPKSATAPSAKTLPASLDKDTNQHYDRKIWNSNRFDSSIIWTSRFVFHFDQKGINSVFIQTINKEFQLCLYHSTCFGRTIFSTYVVYGQENIFRRAKYRLNRHSYEHRNDLYDCWSLLLYSRTYPDEHCFIYTFKT